VVFSVTVTVNGVKMWVFVTEMHCVYCEVGIEF
jgi:hypothetical protein